MTAALPAGPRRLYLYWHGARADAAAAQQTAEALQGALQAAHPGLQAELLCRQDEGAAERITWMEVYTRPGGIDAALQQAIEAGAEALRPWCLGARHVEVFVPVARRRTAS